MSRLESIKERLNKAEGYVGDGITDNTPLVNARLDIQYLLQRLVRYENALLKYSVMIVVDSEDRPHDVGMVAREALEEAALREE